jgi:peptide methionine sulfoxide reductase msrA/msrB
VRVKNSEEYWKERLTSEQYKVLRKKGTEKPFSGKHLKEKRNGVFVCAACGNPLFQSKTKFESGTGWPSFYDVIKKGNVKLREDNSFFTKITEVVCAKCKSHLGHVFPDAIQTPTGKRYCINSCALNFKEKKVKTIYFGAGCFWHVQQVYDCMNLGLKTQVGYMGGDENRFPNPRYKDICSDMTGYIEVVKVEYDEEKVDLNRLLDKFWEIHDPTSIDKQGSDIGSQYRSVIFYTEWSQKRTAKKSKKEKEEELSVHIVTEIRHAQEFYPAEDYHQKYFLKHNGSCKI